MIKICCPKCGWANEQKDAKIWLVFDKLEILFICVNEKCGAEVIIKLPNASWTEVVEIGGGVRQEKQR